MGSASNHYSGTGSHKPEGSGPALAGSGSGGLPVLDSIGQFSALPANTSKKRREWVPWDRQQKRAFHRAQSYLTVWSQAGYHALFVTVTTGPGGPADKLSRHFAELLRRIERHFKFPGLEYFKVETSEGNGVVHAVIAWRPRDGYRQRPFYIPKWWLHEEWKTIHGAWATSVDKVTMHPGSAKGISRYIANQYLAGQEKNGVSALVRMSGSWRRTFGFPLTRAWSYFKAAFPRLKPKRDEVIKPGYTEKAKGEARVRSAALFSAWAAFLGGQRVVIAGEVVTASTFAYSTPSVAAAVAGDWWAEHFGPKAHRWI